MNPSIDASINRQVPIQSLSGGGLALAAKNADVSATVITSKPLGGTLNPNINNRSATALHTNPALGENHVNKAHNQQLFQITVSTGKQNYLLASNTALNPGTQIQIKMTKAGLVVFVKEPQSTNIAVSGRVAGDSPTKTMASTIVTPNRPEATHQRSQRDPVNQQPHQRSENNAVPPPAARSRYGTNPNPTTTHSAVNRAETLTQTIPTKMQPSGDTANATFKAQQVIDQGIRQTLPQQQGLKLLLPLLQQLTKNTHSPAVPSDVLTKIRQLLTAIPTADHLQKPLNLKSAIQNSGIFMEAKLYDKTNKPSPSNSMQNINTVDKDLKSLIQQLLVKASDNQVGKTNPTLNNPATARQTVNTTTPVTTAAPTLTPSAEPDELELAIALDGKPNPLPGHSTPVATAAAGAENIDLALRLLSRQLLASIARIQLNQLESLSPRKINSTDSQGPTNSWFLEIPIVNGRHIDNVEMRIDQEEYKKDEENGEKDKQTIWTVMLSFDLHALGKMNIQLKILDKSVSATIWSQLEHTHKEAKQHIQFLYSGLEKAGVTVTQLDCKLGTPPKNPATLYRQLVDVRT